MHKPQCTNGQFFRALLARGVKPVIVPRESILGAWDLSKLFHHKINRILRALKDLYSKKVTYEQDGQQKDLIVFCQPKHMRCFLAVPNNPEARAVFKREIMQDREWRPRSEYLTQPQLQMPGLGEDVVRGILKELYNEKATYEKDGVAHRAVRCYATGPKKIVLGLDNTKEARGLFARWIIAHKKRSDFARHNKVRSGVEPLEKTMVAYTNLDKEDIQNLGHGFYNRVCAVRRQMTKWNEVGYSFREVMGWNTPGNKGECKVPWITFKTWLRELELVKGIILLAEFCKSNNLDFQTEFAKDTRRIKENRGR